MNATADRTIAQYPTITDVFSALAYAKALADHHMNSMDHDYGTGESSCWARARSGISWEAFERAYRDRCMEWGWDGVGGSGVGVRSALSD